MMTYSFCPTCNNPLMGSDGVDYDCSQCGFRQPLALPEEPPCETCNGDGNLPPAPTEEHQPNEQEQAKP